MIDNVNQFLGTVAETELAKTARRSARTIWNAHRAAFETTRVEAGKVNWSRNRRRPEARRPREGPAETVARKTTRRSTRRRRAA